MCVTKQKWEQDLVEKNPSHTKSGYYQLRELKQQRKKNTMYRRTNELGCLCKEYSTMLTCDKGQS